MIKYRCMCKCGLENYTVEDWLAHWKYGIPRPVTPFGKWPKIRAIYLFLTTRIYINWK